MEEISGLFQHYKGKKYKVIGVGMNSDTLSKSVIYQGLYHTNDIGDHPLFIRALGDFQDVVVRPGYSGARFAKIADGGPYVCKDCGKEL